MYGLKFITTDFDFDTEVLEQQKLDTLDTDGSRLILHNDDYNTFDFVIETLIEVCEHSEEQAEQLTFLVHFRGKATVKEGARPNLRRMFYELVNRGLTAELQ